MLSELITEVRASHAAIATVLVLDASTDLLVDAGADPVDEASLFEIGSITKTVTGTLLADAVVRGETTLEARVGEIIDTAGSAAAVTLGQLATHTSGLPRLAPNHASLRIDPTNPYREFDEEALLAALELVDDPEVTDEPLYSNLGFQLLGHLLSIIGGDSFPNLVLDRVLKPVGCTNARCADVGEDASRCIPGYSGTTQTPRWTQPLPGAGGVEMNIADLGRWIEVNSWPARSPIEEAILLAQEPHWGDRITGRGLGWRNFNGGLFHNGGTGGFRSVCVLVPNSGGVGIMANMADLEVIDGAAVRLVTRVANPE